MKTFLSILFFFTLTILAGAARSQSVFDRDSMTLAPPLPKSLDIDTSHRHGGLSAITSDDLNYYPRAPVWAPLVKITLANAALWAVDRYVFDYDFSHISLESWQRNLREGWTW